jgi:hypothetical protein
MAIGGHDDDNAAPGTVSQVLWAHPSQARNGHRDRSTDGDQPQCRATLLGSGSETQRLGAHRRACFAPGLGRASSTKSPYQAPEMSLCPAIMCMADFVPSAVLVESSESYR